MNFSEHPEASETRRLGSNVLIGVREHYTIEDDHVVGSGAMRDWYSPFVHTELPGELAKLRGASDDDILTFVSTYGALDYPSLAVPSDEDLAAAGDDGWFLKWNRDPIPWIRAHANGVFMCLVLTEALNRSLPSDLLEQCINDFGRETCAEGARIIHPVVTWRGETPEQMARHLRRRLVNNNLRDISRYIGVDEQGKDRSYFWFHARASVFYWHIANLVDGGVVKRCEADGCGGIFIQTDPRQRFCPKRWRQTESSCAARQRQRRHRPKG